MKRLLFLAKITSAIFYSISIFGAGIAWSSEIIVEKVQGNSFVTTGKGQTYFLKQGSKIGHLDDILVEDQSYMTLKGPYDQIIHLSGGTHFSVDFKQKKIILKKGGLWLQAYRNEDQFFIETANGRIDFFLSDVVVYYNQQGQKTQAMVLTGDITLSNIFHTHYTEHIKSGHFSFLQNDYEQGSPRKPTLIGKEAFIKITSLFPKVVPLDKGIVTLYKKNNSKLKDKINQLQNEISSFDVDSKDQSREEYKKAIPFEKVADGQADRLKAPPAIIYRKGKLREITSLNKFEKRKMGDGKSPRVRVLRLSDKTKMDRNRASRSLASIESGNNGTKAQKRRTSGKVKMRTFSFSSLSGKRKPSSAQSNRKAIPSSEDQSEKFNGPKSKLDTQFEKVNVSKARGRTPVRPSKSVDDKLDFIEIQPYYGNRVKKTVPTGGPARSTSSVTRPKPVNTDSSAMKGFEDSLKNHYKVQQKHSDEMRSLIRELNSVNQDYTETY
jgi:hypothetical protein